jgi:hypothetical protein
MQNLLYEEKILSKEILGVCLIVAFLFLVLMIYQIYKGPIGNCPAPNWVFLLFFLLVSGFGFVFSNLGVKITSKNLDVGYGFIRYKIPLENVANCYLDETSAFWYGGWGIRFAKIADKWRLVYNVIGTPRVILSLKQGRFKEFAFSTKKPQELIKIIRTQLNLP